MTAPQVRCIDKGQHSWPNTFGADGYMRCQLGCGARRPAKGRWIGPIEGPDEQEPILCVSANGRHSWPIHGDDDGWLRCQRPGCGAGRRGGQKPIIPAHEVPAYKRPEPVEEDTWTPRPVYVPLEPREASDCARCGARELVERDFDGEVEFVCVNGHRRYGRSPEELAEMLAQEAAAHTGKQRRREPSHGGARL